MNYYEHHLGDYIRDTAHLSMIEEGAYRRLLDAYYVRELPLPTDQRECCKLARAQSKPEKTAVAYILKTFFQLQEDGYHQGRVDREIERYAEGEPERQAKREADKERQRRARERRAGLFSFLRDHGIVPAFDSTTSHLEMLKSRVTPSDSHGLSQQMSHTVTRDNTASQSPVPRSQSPTPNPHTLPDPDLRAERKPDQGSVCGSFTKIGGESEPSNGLASPRVYQSTEDVMAELRREHQRARK